MPLGLRPEQNKRLRGLLPIALSLLLAPACADLDETSSTSTPEASIPDQEAWGWSTVITQGGRRRAVVEAAHFQKYDDSKQALLDGGVTVTFYDQTGKRKASRLTAREAEVDMESNDMKVMGSVVLVSEQQTRLETDTLTWVRESGQVAGVGPVTLRRPDGSETGFGFEATSDLTRWKMRRVVTRFAPSDSLQ